MDGQVKTGAVIQARMSSSRLPGKVLHELPFGSGAAVLDCIIERAMRSSGVEKVVVATTLEKEDDRIAAFAAEAGVPLFRGETDDVLDRYCRAASEHDLDIVVRLTGDNPCIDPALIDMVLDAHGEERGGITSTRGYPLGTNVEAFGFEALQQACDGASGPLEREHVTPYMYSSGKFPVRYLLAPESSAKPEIRVTLDTQEDYILLCAVYDYLYRGNPFFGHEDIVRLFQEKPWLGLINGRVMQKHAFDTLEGELEEAIKLIELQGLKRAASEIRKTIKEL